MAIRKNGVKAIIIGLDAVLKPRAEWLAKRKAKTPTATLQMHYARQGVITDEMRYIAHAKKLNAGVGPR